MTGYEQERRERERRNNVRRLAYAIYQRAGDGAFIERLAGMLHYMPGQLAKDIEALESYTAEKAQQDAEADAD